MNKIVIHTKLNTIDEPPIELTGFFEDNKIELFIKWESFKSGYKSLINVLGYTGLGVALMILIKEYPDKTWTYIIALISLPIPYIFSKIYTFFNYSEPDPKHIIKEIQKTVKGKIVLDTKDI